MPTRGGGVRRLIFTGNAKTNLFNAYTPGASVGGQNASVRSALKRRATLSAGSINNMNSRKPGCGSCNTSAGAGSSTNSNNNAKEKEEAKIEKELINIEKGIIGFL